MKALRILVPIACAGAFLLAVLGSWIRINDAGLTCPDWPLCQGAVVPALHGGVVLEWAHRALASLEGVLIAVIVIIGWPKRTTRAGLRTGLIALAAIFVIQCSLGGATVLLGNTPLSVVAHWAAAMTLLAALVALSISLWVPAEPALSDHGVWRYLATAAALAFVAMCIGSYVSSSYAGLACASFPDCGGSFYGRTPAQIAQMLHRFIAGSFVVVATLATIATLQNGSTGARRAATVGLLLAFLQAILGIATIRLGLPLWIREAHAANAGATFIAFVAATTFAALVPNRARRAAPHAAPATVPT